MLIFNVTQRILMRFFLIHKSIQVEGLYVYDIYSTVVKHFSIIVLLLQCEVRLVNNKWKLFTHINKEVSNARLPVGNSKQWLNYTTE
jgi:hypothetical protein